VIATGLDQIALKPFAAWIVVRMEFANQENAVVIQALLVTSAINCLVMRAALNMANAKMEPASALKVGMDDTALCLVAKMDARVMVSVHLRMANTNVYASKAGPVPIAPFNWK